MTEKKEEKKRGYGQERNIGFFANVDAKTDAAVRQAKADLNWSRADIVVIATKHIELLIAAERESE